MSNRKTFLQQSALLAAGVFFLPSCMSGSKSSKKIGLQLYTLRDVIGQDVAGVIKKIADIGYRDVETYGYSATDGFWGLSPKEFNTLLDENNLKSSSGHYGLEEYLRTDKEDELRSAIEAAKMIGNEYVTLPYLSEDLRGSVDTYKIVAEKMNKMGKICKESGTKFAYHNHSFEFTDLGDGETGYQILLENTDPNLVQFELDLYWVARSGNDPIALFNKHHHRFSMWHVKDMDKTNQDLNTEIGSGSIDFKPIFKEAKLSGMKHFFVEQENFSAGKDPFESIKDSYVFIENSLVS